MLLEHAASGSASSARTAILPDHGIALILDPFSGGGPSREGKHIIGRPVSILLPKRPGRPRNQLDALWRAQLACGAAAGVPSRRAPDDRTAQCLEEHGEATP